MRIRRSAAPTERTDERWRPAVDVAQDLQDAPRPQPRRLPTTRVVAGAVLVAAAVIAATFFGSSTGGRPGTVFEVGSRGEVRAEYLADGSPVFVVSSLDGAAHVVSAVEPRARGLVTWCEDTRTFVETGGTSRWDEQGRYLFGPAEAGLALHSIAGDPSGATVQITARLRPRPISDDPEPVSVEGRCYSAGGAGGLRHQRADMAAQPAEGATGERFTRVSGSLSIDPAGVARLCPLSGCSGGARAVTSTFHDTVALDDFAGQARGEFLVRLTPQGAFADLVALDGAFDMLQQVDKPTPFSPADVTAELIEVASGPDGPRLVMAQPVEPRPIFPDGPPGAPPASRTWPLAEDATIISLTTQGQYPYADFLTVAELQELVAADGPLPVEVHLDGHGVGVSLRPVAPGP